MKVWCINNDCDMSDSCFTKKMSIQNEILSKNEQLMYKTMNTTNVCFNAKNSFKKWKIDIYTNDRRNDVFRLKNNVLVPESAISWSMWIFSDDYLFHFHFSNWNWSNWSRRNPHCRTRPYQIYMILCVEETVEDIVCEMI